MKKKYSFFYLFLFSLSISNVLAQNKANGGAFLFNSEKTVCLTNDQRDAIKIMLQKNTTKLQIENKLFASITKNSQQVLFSWPVQQANGFTYNDVWAISNYVDHNTAFPNQVTDYNCGTKSYDTPSGYNHQGVDIYLWPFSWYMVDNNQAEVIAAQSGQIIAKSDGNFDRSCSLNNSQWNSVYVRHSDGSTAWYGHMKNGSLTSKNIGDMVVQGEFLGVVASSGNSTGPHLHFEVYDNSNNLIDPYSGNCNNLNSSTWWNSQKPYVDSNINAVLTHTAPPAFNTCPTTETTNINNDFIINDAVYFAIYLRDQVANTNVNLKITRPDNSVFANWNFTLTANYSSSYWYWWNNVDATGVWKWEATYQGQTVVHTFNVAFPLSTKDVTFEATVIYPNPFKDIITINSKSKIITATITDLLGKEILKIRNKVKPIHKIDVSSISNGIYFLTIESHLHKKKTTKIIKKQPK